MQWTEYIQQINRDEIDNDAIERYSFWRSQIVATANACDSMERRKMISFYRLDPDILNEFCFYMPQYWDRLINWAKMFYKENDFSYEKKLQRAIMIIYGTDPDIIPDEDVPCLWWNGGEFEELHKSAMEYWNDYSVPFENLVFSFDRFSGTLLMEVKDDRNRGYQTTPADFVFPPDLKAIIFGEESQDPFYITIGEENIDDESEWIPM
jgi:hypothetical protein